MGVNIFEKVLLILQRLGFQDASFVPNGNTNVPVTEGTNGPEVAQRLNQQVAFPKIYVIFLCYLCM